MYRERQRDRVCVICPLWTSDNLPFVDGSCGNPWHKKWVTEITSTILGVLVGEITWTIVGEYPINKGCLGKLLMEILPKNVHGIIWQLLMLTIVGEYLHWGDYMRLLTQLDGQIGSNGLMGSAWDLKKSFGGIACSRPNCIPRSATVMCILPFGGSPRDMDGMTRFNSIAVVSSWLIVAVCYLHHIMDAAYIHTCICIYIYNLFIYIYT